MTKYLSAILSDGKVRIVEKTLPLPDKDTVIIKLLASGICRADVKEVSSSRDIPEDRGPLFGHEINGMIEYAGDETGFQRNTFVAFNPNITKNRTTGFAEYMIIKDSKERLSQAITPYNSDLDPNKTILAEPFACIIHSLDMLQKNIESPDIKDKNIAIIGAGNSGMSFGLLAKQRGAKIKIFNIDDGRLEFAENIFQKDELTLLENYKDYSGEFDVSIICPTRTTNEVLNIAYTLIKSKGALHIYGGTRSNDTFLDSGIDIDKIRRNESIEKIEYKNKALYLSGAYGFDEKDFKKTFDIIEDFPLDKFISKVITFEEFPEIIMDMASHEVDFPGKVIIRF